MFPKPNKYRAKRTEYDGMHFPSKFEASVWAHQKLREKAGEVCDLIRYASVRLSEADISYKPDGRGKYSGGREFWWEAKGVETERWRVVKKLWAVYGPGPLEVYKKNNRGIYLAETIIPRAA